MRVAILAWGSLVWEKRDLAIAQAFKPSGPTLPLEFSRVSLDRRLTLVIDETHGTPCATYAAPSMHSDLDGAIDNLRLREGMPGRDGVGFIDTAAHTHSDTAWNRHPRAIPIIQGWALRRGYSAVIWTALASNFHEPEKAGARFSIEAAIGYLETLSGESRDRALAYFRKAPVEVQTPLRAAVSARWS